MTLAESRKIENMTLSYTNDFLKEIAKVINDDNAERAKFRLACIDDEISGWACDEDEGAAELVKQVREMLHVKFA